MRALGIAILLGFGGTVAAALWTFVIGLAGAPGGLLTAVALDRSGSDRFPLWGLGLTIAGQLYAALTFAAFIIATAQSRLAGEHGLGTWAVWAVAFLVAVAPPWIAAKDAARRTVQNVQQFATGLTAMLTVVGFFLLLFLPRVREFAWGWVPHL